MTFSFKTHQEGCTPFSPCKSCDVAAVLRSNLTDEQFVEFTKTVDNANFSFSEHHPGCTPATPCKNCAMMAWLRATLTVPKYGDLVFILTGERPVDPEMHRRLLMRVDSLELSPRSANCLRNDNIVTIGDLVTKTEGDMLRTPNFGRKGLQEIKEVLAGLGLHLGMKVQT